MVQQKIASAAQPGHQQGLQLLVGVAGGRIEVPEAVCDVCAVLSGQRGQSVVKLYL